MAVSDTGQIVLTGATSSLGTVLVERLRARWPARDMVALTRSTTHPVFERFNVQPVQADLSDPATYQGYLTEGCVVVAVAHRAFTDQMLPAINDARARACYAVTSTSVFVTHHPEVALYRAIEDRMRASHVPVTILRPSMLYGRGRDQNISRLVKVLSRTPVFPIFRDGRHLMQPVYVDDVADAVFSAIERDARGEYNLAGPEPISYNELLRTTANALGRDVRLVHIPHRIAEVVVAGLGRIPRFPIDVDQVRRLGEDKTYDIGPAIRDLGYRPRAFRDGIRDEIAAMFGQTRETDGNG